MRNRRAFQTHAIEDATSQAGWMYADLFLALMVIFLATISFIPELSGSNGSGAAATPQSVVVKSLNFDQGMAQLYEGFDLVRLRADIENFKKKLKLNNDAEVIYVQVIGGYAKNENPSVGTLAAINYSVEMKKQAADLFGAAAIKLDTSKGIPSGSVALRITFAPKITN
jgi:predicted secreted hydrolase